MRKDLQVAPGSLQETANQSGVPMENAFMNVQHVILMDVSGSMGTSDVPGFTDRYDAALKQLESLQKMLPGKIALICFGSEVVFCPGGYPNRLGGGTDLTSALTMLEPLDGTDVQFYVITDGHPNSPDTALKLAGTFETKVNTIYIGPDTGYDSSGYRFCMELSALKGGKAVKTKETGKFEEDFIKMLNPGNPENGDNDENN
jgi:hypothetical protein